MIIGMDTDQPFNSRHFTRPRTDGQPGTMWDAFQVWLGGSPAFAGRYFNSNAAGFFQAGEARAVRQMSGGNLTRIVPIQSAPRRPDRPATQELGVNVPGHQVQRAFDLGRVSKVDLSREMLRAWDEAT
jgi:hypothetical protein